MILLIDNYDSFTFNLVHLFGSLGAACDVRRNDALTPAEALALRPDAIVLSPGPCAPEQAGICLDLIRAATGRVPVLGVCLGHQAIGQAFGGAVVRAPAPMHGKVDRVRHTGAGVFEGVPDPFEVVRYHSLVVRGEDMPACLEPVAWTGDGVVMGFRHREHPVHGVQFHPESIATQHGAALAANFLRLAGIAAGTNTAGIAAPQARAA